MTRGQHPATVPLIVSLCFLANGLDGFDLLSIAFAGPIIAKTWAVHPEVMGFVFSAAPVGMAVGALVLGMLGDRWGRRQALVTSLAIMGAGSLACAFAPSVLYLVPMRFLTGIGIGGALANLTTVVAELVSADRRNRTITLLHVAYSIGTIGGAWLAGAIIPTFGWKPLFMVGGIPPLVIAPVLWWLLAATPIQPARQTAGAAHPQAGFLAMWRRLFTDGLARPSVLIVAAFFLCWLAIYFLMNWIPAIMVDIGYQYKDAMLGITFFNFGALAGTISIGYITTVWPKVTPISLFLLFGGAGTLVLGVANTSTTVFYALAFTGFCTLGGLIGLYLTAVWTYPPALRSTGLGFALSVGRIGAVIGPALGGFLIAWHIPHAVYFGFFATLLFISGFCVLALRNVVFLYSDETRGPFQRPELLRPVRPTVEG